MASRIAAAPPDTSLDTRHSSLCRCGSQFDEWKVWVHRMISLIDVLTVVNKFLIWPTIALHKLTGGPFTSFENSLLTNIVSKLVAENRQILSEHIDAINYIQRDAYDRQIRFYKFTPFSYVWERNSYFNKRALGETRICSFQVAFENGETLKGTLKAVDGVFAVINFGEYARRFRNVPIREVTVTHATTKN
jgi:hypothetical protein